MFINKFGTHDATGVWYETLKTLTPLALEKGLERLSNLSTGHKFCEFPPNCLQFRALCLAFYEEQNLPGMDEAYRELTSLAYKTKAHGVHPLVKVIAKRLPPEYFDIEADYVAYPIFKSVYEQVCSLVKQGHELVEPFELFIPKKQSDHAIARHYLTQIKLCLGVKP
ncbi:hypothetical protein Lnau_3100 [Legionella nautarum]|uniref:Uncharacterized protein n=1 Tax=Legionella nautarum TaxID=45070 RepID=A0A0W0WIM7_9GAMM|nr:hypothetical protein [Legionella nautarum]KTD32189.1 hypothetical protein Lnau_3100 [Legionella nautarum]